MGHQSRGCRAPEIQIWADIGAIRNFENPEISGLGIWLMEVVSINPHLSMPPPSEDSRTLVQFISQQRSQLELSKVLMARPTPPKGILHCKCVTEPQSAGESFFASILRKQRTF